MDNNQTDENSWAELAALIASLPEEDQARYQGSIRKLVHDLRQCLSIHHSAEALLRRTIPETPENLELLDSIRTANQGALKLVTDLAHHFDSENS